MNLIELLEEYKDAKSIIKTDLGEIDDFPYIEFINQMIKCDFKNFKLKDGKIVCLKADLTKSTWFDDFLDELDNVIRFFSADELSVVFEFAEKLLEKGIIYLEFYVNSDSFKKAIEKFGKERFKKLLKEVWKMVKNDKTLLKKVKIYTISKYMTYFNDCDLELIDFLYKLYSKINYSFNNFNFYCFDEAYKNGILSEKDIENIIKKIERYSDHLKHYMEGNKQFIEHFVKFLKIICNDYKFEKYWDILKKEFYEYIKPEYKCFNVADLFEI
jgi:predicted transcriptional regulator